MLASSAVISLTADLASPNSIVVFGLVVELVFDAREAGVHRALDHDHRVAVGDLEDRHPVDRRGGRVLGRRVGDVVGADHERDVGARELGVGLVHLLELVVGDVGLGQQHVHVAGHAPGDRVDRVADLHLAFFERLGQLAHGVLGLSDRHPVAGHDHHAVGVGELDRGVGGARRAHRAGVLAGAAGALDRAAAAEAAGDDRRDRAVHRDRHQVREDRARGADDHAGDDQRGVVQRDAGGGGGEAGEGVQQRDHDRHVGAADREHDRVAEQRGAHEHADEEQFGVGAGDEVDARGEREHQQHAVDDLLGGAERDRPPGEDFLELAEGDVRAPERDRADDRGEHREDRDIRGHAASRHSDGGDRAVGYAVQDDGVRVRRVCGPVAAELRPGDQEHGAAADAVEQRHHLRHRRHLHLARRGHADGRCPARCRARSAPSCPRWARAAWR